MRSASTLKTGVEAMVGQEAVVTEALSDPHGGTVRINGELWTARSLSGPVVEGERVTVEQVDGLKLWVRRPSASLEVSVTEEERECEMTFMTVLLIVAALVAGFALVTGIRIVPQAKVMVVERLGKFHHVAHSGLNILIPFLDSPRAIEMRTGQPLHAQQPGGPARAGDGLRDGAGHHPRQRDDGGGLGHLLPDRRSGARSLYQVENLALAIEQLTMTNLRNIMGGLTLDQTLTSRETVNTKLRMVLDEATEKWGVKVTRVELREIEPPQAIKEAMAKQMTAERERRAEVTKAEGDKSAAILQAEGEKISRILRAEAERDAEVARAEGHKRAVVLDAEGKAEATRLVFEAVHAGRATPEVLALRYLETLQELGKGSNKVFVPYEASAALGSVGMLKELFSKDGETGRPPCRDFRGGRERAGDGAHRGAAAAAGARAPRLAVVPAGRVTPRHEASCRSNASTRPGTSARATSEWRLKRLPPHEAILFVIQAHHPGLHRVTGGRGGGAPGVQGSHRRVEQGLRPRGGRRIRPARMGGCALAGRPTVAERDQSGRRRVRCVRAGHVAALGPESPRRRAVYLLYRGGVLPGANAVREGGTPGDLRILQAH